LSTAAFGTLMGAKLAVHLNRGSIFGRLN
jgi:hypothetical protein